jgi:peptidoglycan/LPS O-acetylase OafA/YrhL
VTCVISVQVLNFVDARKVLVDALWAALFVANIRFSRDGTNYFVHNATSPLQHYWSLAVEEQFYLVWPIVIALTLVVLRARVRRRRRARHGAQTMRTEWIAAPLAAIFVVSLTLSIVQTTATSTTAYFSTLDRAWELAVGGLLAVGLPRLERLSTPVRAVATWVGVAAIAIAATVFSASTLFPGSAALLPVLGAAAVIGGGVGAPKFGLNRLLRLRPLRYVGDRSYSLYLWHFPALILGAAWVGHTLSTAANLELLALAFVVSVLSYRWVEDPIRKARPLSGSQSRRALIMWPTSLATIVLVVVVVWPAGLRGGSDSTTAAFRTLSVPQQVEQSIRAAQHGAAIPSDLTPSIENIVTSFKSIGDCSGYMVLRNKICQFGDPKGKKTAVLFGNSHSTMWIPALSPIMKAAHWKFYPVVKEACAYPDWLGNDYGCSDWYQWAVQQIRDKHPDLIIMGGDYSEPGWQTALSKAITTMKRIAPKVAFLQLAPGLPDLPTNCLAASGATLGTCLFKEPTAWVDLDHEEARIVKNFGLHYIPTRQWFCAGSLCPTVVGSIVTYADVGHVTHNYAQHLIPVMAAALKSELH